MLCIFNESVKVYWHFSSNTARMGLHLEKIAKKAFAVSNESATGLESIPISSEFSLICFSQEKQTSKVERPSL